MKYVAFLNRTARKPGHWGLGMLKAGGDEHVTDHLLNSATARMIEGIADVFAHEIDPNGLVPSLREQAN